MNSMTTSQSSRILFGTCACWSNASFQLSYCVVVLIFIAILPTTVFVLQTSRRLFYSIFSSSTHSTSYHILNDSSSSHTLNDNHVSEAHVNFTQYRLVFAIVATLSAVSIALKATQSSTSYQNSIGFAVNAACWLIYSLVWYRHTLPLFSSTCSGGILIGLHTLLGDSLLVSSHRQILDIIDVVFIIAYSFSVLAVTALEWTQPRGNISEHFVEGSLSQPLLAVAADDRSISREVITNSFRADETGRSIFSLLTFSWMSRLLRLGRARQLEPNDLHSVRTDDEATFVEALLQRSWLKHAPSLSLSLILAFGGKMAWAALFKIFHDILAFVPPILLPFIIASIRELGPTGLHDGVMLVVILFASSLLQTAFLHQYFHACLRTGMRVRAALVGSIYCKSLRLSSGAKATYTSGDAINLISVDAKRMEDMMPYAHMLWSAFFQGAICIYLLYSHIGASVFGGVLVIVLLLPLNGLVARRLRDYQKQLMRLKDERVLLTSEVLTAIKVIKLYAWELSFGKRIDATREKELRELRTYLLFYLTSMFLWSLTPTAVTLAGFTCFSLLDKTALTPEIAFTTLSLFNILRFPISVLPMVIANFVEASVSLARIQKLLVASEVDPNHIDANHHDVPGSIEIRDLSCYWDDNADVSAICIDKLSIAPGSFVVVVGATGAGTSAFINAILGELHTTQGDRRVCGTIAYTSQLAWIQNASVRQNILMGTPMRQLAYDEVLAACALIPDLQMLPRGDLTEIGERGVNLSGGQKMRVSLARAVYADTDMCVMDAPLAAVDAHVARHIFVNCINGILKNRTRVLVTHNENIISAADIVVYIKDGTMCSADEYKATRQNCKASSESPSKLQDKLQEVNTGVALSDELQNHQQQNDEEVFTVNRGRAESNKQLKMKNTNNSTELNIPTHESGLLVQEESRQIGRVRWTVYAAYIERCGGWILVIAILFMLMISTFANLAASRWLAYWSEQPDASSSLRVYLGVFVLLSVISVVSLQPAMYFILRGSLRAARMCHRTLLTAMLRAPIQFFDTTPLGRIVNRFSRDQFIIDEKLGPVLYSWLLQLFRVLAIILAILWVTPVFVLLLVPLFLFYSRVQVFYIASARELKRLDSVLRSPILSHFSESLDGAVSIRAFQRCNIFRERAALVLNANLRAHYPSISANRWLAVRLETVGSIVVAAASLLAVLSRHTISPALGALSISYAMTVTQSLNWCVRMSSDRETNIVSVERNLEFSTVPSEAELIVEDNQPVPAWPQNGKICIRDLCLRYRPGLNLVLNGVTVTINAGQRIGICGRTGSGKSTLILALMRLIEASSGCIEIDGIDISSIGLYDLRSRIALIPQDPMIFSGSVRFNLDPFGMASDDELRESLRIVGLEKDICSLDQVVQESGQNFSVGQRQLLCIARALRARSKIVLMDEATSSISNSLQDQIESTIRSAFQSCTVITVAHRLETILDYDQVLVMECGRIIEQGAPSTLLSDRLSHFAKLVQANSQYSNDSSE